MVPSFFVTSLPYFAIDEVSVSHTAEMVKSRLVRVVRCYSMTDDMILAVDVTATISLINSLSFNVITFISTTLLAVLLCFEPLFGLLFGQKLLSAIYKYVEYIFWKMAKLCQ